MAELVELRLDDGTVVFVEAAPVADPLPDRGLQRAGRGDPGALQERATASLEAALGVVRPTAERIVALLRDVSGPEEVGVEFGVGFTAKAGVFFASVDSNVAFKVSLKWKNSGGKDAGTGKTG
jgi:hypothetical protein